jgi:hypothetical protein
MERVRITSAGTGQMSYEALVLILQNEGRLNNFDAGKVASFFKQGGVINVPMFEEYFAKSLALKALNSQTLQRLITMVKS